MRKIKDVLRLKLEAHLSHERIAAALKTISQLMGHAQLSTTGRYLYMDRPSASANNAALALLSQLPRIPNNRGDSSGRHDLK